ncbi:hypothetical protein C8R46DRAFT_871624, partial [Mycena filopes]
ILKAPPSFGLMDVSESRWSALVQKLYELNAKQADTSYKLVFFRRHGQGWRGSPLFYGRMAWDEYGDGELIWGRELFKLCSESVREAARVNHLWQEELGAGVPLPEKLYCSPMTRAIQTNLITFEDVSAGRPIIENCREEYGEHTCDMRNTRTYIRHTFPQFGIDDDLTKDDELWEADARKAAVHATARAKTVLDRTF